MTGPTLRALSCGAGVQSSALILLAARGEIPRFDVAIFADTDRNPLGRLAGRYLASVGRLNGRAIVCLRWPSVAGAAQVKPLSVTRP